MDPPPILTDQYKGKKKHNVVEPGEPSPTPTYAP